MNDARELLEALRVPSQRVVYVQSSVDWLQRAGFGAVETLSALRDWTGEAGTLVMPSYPFHSTHLEYLESRPVYHVDRTPSAIGLLPEIFRRTRGVVRSLDPDFCVTALGRDAQAIAGGAPATADPFGADSTYQRMLDRHTTLVGLGVSLNTNSFVHALDSRLQASYPSPVYADVTFTAKIIDSAGCSTAITRRALRSEFQQLTRPSAIVAAMEPSADAFTTLTINGAVFFRWDLDPWAAWCLAHGRSRAAGTWPCWLTRLGDQVE